ncbi:MAG: hypothetical protein U9N47_11795, partial [Thermodesulfobacteriota bacterium]|nr:hypothetical protein [Thermodesulfobacteriota bacterium]
MEPFSLWRLIYPKYLITRAVRRISEHFDCCPDQLTPEQLEIYFGELVDSHSWSTVKVDRLGLQ